MGLLARLWTAIKGGDQSITSSLELFREVYGSRLSAAGLAAQAGDHVDHPAGFGLGAEPRQVDRPPVQALPTEHPQLPGVAQEDAGAEQDRWGWFASHGRSLWRRGYENKSGTRARLRETTKAPPVARRGLVSFHPFRSRAPGG